MEKESVTGSCPMTTAVLEPEYFRRDSKSAATRIVAPSWQVIPEILSQTHNLLTY